MAVKRIIGKKIVKHNTDGGNFKPPVQQEKIKPDVNGNTIENNEDGVFQGDIYGETKYKEHLYQPDNGNLQMTELMTGLMNKLDNLKNLNPEKIKKNRAIEVDIKREIAIDKLDVSSIKSDKVENKVNKNKLNKLKKLRRRNGS